MALVSALNSLSASVGVLSKSLVRTPGVTTSGFADQSEQRRHFRSDWHRFNVKLKLAGKPVFSETEFERVIDEQGEVCYVTSTAHSSCYATAQLLSCIYVLQVSSISGSGTDSDGENSHKRTVQKSAQLIFKSSGAQHSDCLHSHHTSHSTGHLVEQMSDGADGVERQHQKDTSYICAEMTASSESQQPHAGLAVCCISSTCTVYEAWWMIHMPQQLFMLLTEGRAFGVWRPLLLSEQDSRSTSDTELLQRLVDLTQTAKCWAVILSKGGHFAAAVFDLRPTQHAQHSKSDAPNFKELAHKSYHRYVVRSVCIHCKYLGCFVTLCDVGYHLLHHSTAEP